MSEQMATSASQAELKEAISELEQYRDRIVHDILEMAQKLKLPRKKAEKDLENHPEIARIDAILEQLRSQLED